MFDKFWNKKLSGLMSLVFCVLRAGSNKILDKIFELIWNYNLNKVGSNFRCQKGLYISFPKNIDIGDNVNIGRDVLIFTEISDSKLIIGSDCSINARVQLDYSGDLSIGENVFVSEDSVILSHDHGYDPRSKPKKSRKKIDDNVWIGQNSMILPQVKIIGKNSIIAAGSVVTKNVIPNVIVGGNPAKILKELNH